MWLAKKGRKVFGNVGLCFVGVVHFYIVMLRGVLYVSYTTVVVIR